MKEEQEEVSFSLVHPSLVDHCWVDAGYYLNKAAKGSRGRYDIFDIKRDIYSGAQHLWILFRGDDDMIAAVTTQFFSYPGRKNLSIAFIGSNDEMGWVKYRGIILDTIERFAIENGCDGIEATGRQGWVKLLAPYGWEKTFTVVEKDLRGGMKETP